MPKSTQQQDPLSEAVFFILLSIHQSPKHGYAILQEVAYLSDGRVKLSTGTLYGAIKRLLDKKWIVRVINDEVSPNKREKKLYALTNSGKQALEVDISRMRSLLLTADQIQQHRGL